jgi:predicted esterase YcpF (UPF0227 family)
MTKQKPDAKRKQEPRRVPISQMQADGILQRQQAVNQAQAQLAQVQAASDHYLTAILAASDITAIAEVQIVTQPEPHLIVTLPSEQA